MAGTILTAGVGVLTSGTVYIIGKVLSLDKTLAAHVASDSVVFENLENSTKRIEAKVDRLVDHLLDH